MQTTFNRTQSVMHRATAVRVMVAWLGLVTCVTGAGSAKAEPSPLPPEVGYNAGEMETPRSAALGGGVRATGTSIEALYYNPAGMPTTRVYHLAGAAQIWHQAQRQSYGAAAVDSLVNRQRIAGGLAANWTGQDPDGVDRDSFDLRAAVAAPVSDRFFLGAGLRYLSLKQGGYPGGGLPPSLASGGLSDTQIVEDITFDAGLTIKLTDELSVAAVGSNLTEPGHSFLPLTFGGGLGFGARQFSLELDAVADFTTYDETSMRLMGGGEILLGDAFPLRAGFRYDEGAQVHAIGGGIGYVAPEFSIDASVRGHVQGEDSLTFVFGFRYHIESSGVGGGLY